MSVRTIQTLDAWQGEAECKTCSIRDSVLFAKLDESLFEKLHHPIEQVCLSTGSTLYRAGQTGNHLYTLRQGLVKLVQYLPDGSQRIVRIARDTDLIGLESLLGQPYQHDAICLQPCEFCSLPVEVIKRMAGECPDLQNELLNRWQRALSEADAWLTELSTGSARQRVARLLLRLARQNKEHLCYLFSREDMGSMLGVTTETASRTIAEFKRQKLLVDSGKGCYSCDLEGLQRLAED
ncbi:MAG: Crp/Fnr family transcriptional regulator [Gammaproteobacteria bacterium]|nr:Crp/Fnr family transcriptional regulator [Gammaproteobacteria bacterium]